MNCLKLTRSLFVLLLTLAIGPLAGTATADVVLEDIFWKVIGSSVEFHALFHNTDPTIPSGPVDYELSSQPYGAFVPSAEVILPGASPTPGLPTLATSHCDSLIVWNGNVDVFWTPGTGASVGVHFGTMYVCPRAVDLRTFTSLWTAQIRRA